MSIGTKWALVRVGILLVAISAIVLGSGALFRAIADLFLLIAAIGDKEPGTAFKVIGRIGNGLIFGAGLTAVVGYVFCIFAPNKYGSLAFAIVSLCLGAVNLVMSLMARIIAMMRDRMAGGLELLLSGVAFSTESKGVFLTFSILITLFFFAELVLFPLYLVAVARSVRARWAVGPCIGILVMAAVIALLQMVSVILAYVGITGVTRGKGLAITWTIISLVSYLALVGQMIWYALVQFQIRGQIE
jgi:hypothetical protein